MSGVRKVSKVRKAGIGKPSASSARKAPARRPALTGKAPSLDEALSAQLLARVRAHCLSLERTSERLSHGSPSFFVDEKHPFVYFCDNHHHDGRIALWCAAPEGAQSMLVDSDAGVYFVPPYVGHQGWVGVRLDRSARWGEIAAVIESAHATRLVARPRRAR
jgi:hypothetical protein